MRCLMTPSPRSASIWPRPVCLAYTRQVAHRLLLRHAVVHRYRKHRVESRSGRGVEAACDSLLDSAIGRHQSVGAQTFGHRDCWRIVCGRGIPRLASVPDPR